MRQALVHGHILCARPGSVPRRGDRRRVYRRYRRGGRCHSCGMPPSRSQGRMLLPGFIDTQVNGGGGVLFNDDPSVDTIRRIGAAHRKFGTTGFLPTLISDDLRQSKRAIEAVRRRFRKVCLACWASISRARFSARRAKACTIRQIPHPGRRGFALLTSLKNGKTLVTLAPEMTTPETIGRSGGGGRDRRRRPHQCQL